MISISQTRNLQGRQPWACGEEPDTTTIACCVLSGFQFAHLMAQPGLAQRRPLFLGAEKLPTLTPTFLDTCHSPPETPVRHYDLAKGSFAWSSGAPEPSCLLCARPG